MKKQEALVDENEFFRQATLRISSSLDVEVAMRRCMEFLQQYIPASGMSFGVYDPTLNTGRILASIWPPELKKPGKTIFFPRDFWDWMKNRWAEPWGIMVLNDVESESPPLPQAMSMIYPPDTSHLIMELELERRRLGSVALFVEGKHRYNDFHVHLMSLLHEPFAAAMSNILQHQEIERLKDLLADDNRYLHQEMLRMTGDTIVGADFGLKETMGMVRQVSQLDSPVLLMGETGVGKEVIANAIHFSSKRRGRTYLKVNCGAIPETLIDSELFGHEKGAFTGAISLKRGHFERAHTGTIFLDEIGELPLPAQVRLLRVLQQHEIQRVGGSETIPVDVRIISATNQNLEEMVRRRKFREDLWFRINVFPMTIPPLRQRIEDIPALASHFIERKSKELKIKNLPTLAPGALDQLLAYDWPGNVRELENLIERALILSKMTDGDDVLRFEKLPSVAVLTGNRRTQKDSDVILPLNEIIAAHIEKALDRSGGRVEGENGAAQILGLHPSTLRGRMRKLRIPHGRMRLPKRI